MNKICPGCNEERDIEQDFCWKNQQQGIRQRWCKYCQAHAMKVHYQNNTKIYRDRALIRNSRINNENKQKLFTYLSTHPCIDCGNSDIRCLEFDHVEGTKTDNIARMITRGKSWNTIEAEIAKCEVRCANCHRIKTLERGNWWRHRQTQNKK
jgi:hypothetical protein